MKKWTSGMLAVSLAGHDKGAIYLVIEEVPAGSSGLKDEPLFAAPGEGEYLLLADGKRRTLEHPKRKKVKHTQVIRHLPESLTIQMREFTLDAHVRKILKEFREYQEAPGNQ